MSMLAETSGPSSPTSYVKEVTIQNFMQEVVQASLQTPVLAYFTAPWCGPCKQYGPLLEKVVNEAKGALRLARIDVDKNPQLAQQFRIQSVPMVYIFLQGQPLDGFAGALPESQLKQIVAQLVGATPEQEMMQATLEAANALLSQGETQQAAAMYQQIYMQDNANVDALVGLARCLVAEGELAQAEQLLASVPQDKQTLESVVAARAALTLAQSAPQAGDIAALHQKLKADPLDHEARLTLASALFAQNKHEEAVDELLAIIARNRDWNEGAARTKLLAFFEALGHTHPVTMQGRRKLSSLLFS